MRNKTVSQNEATFARTGEQIYKQQKPLYIPLLAVCGSVCFGKFAYLDFLLNPGSLVTRLPILALLIYVAVHGIGQWFRIRSHNNRAEEELYRELTGSTPSTSSPVSPRRRFSWRGASGRTLEAFSLVWWLIGIMRTFLTILFLYSGLDWLARNESSLFLPMEDDSLTEMIVVHVSCLLIILLSLASTTALAKRVQAGMGFTQPRAV